MISIAEALSLVLQKQKDFGIEQVPLLQCAGRILAHDVKADRDYPAFNRVMMDGIAVSSSALSKGFDTFTIQAVQAAGDEPLTLDGINYCIEIMTGAALPTGTDTIIPYEDIIIEGGLAKVSAINIQPLQNIHQKGTDNRQGELLVKAGTKLTAAHTGVLASVGMVTVPVKRLPKVVVCSTGNELVEPGTTPLPHQVRRSNPYMLAAFLQNEHITPVLHHLPDDKEIMTAAIAQLVHSYDVILFSGAVSKGKYDHLPAVLETIGMQTIFHRIAQKPGKPMLFGEYSNGALVFGFPGNPISTFVCYQLYFKAWLYACLKYDKPATMARLASEVNFKPNLAYHLPVQFRNDDGLLKAVPVLMNTSGDVPSLANIEGLVTLPPEQVNFEKDLLVNVNLC